MHALVPNGDRSVVLADVAAPEPTSGEVLLDVLAFSVNRGETFQLDAPRPGWRPGKDVAGRVARAAADGSGPAAGTLVVCHLAAGGWAEQATAAASGVIALPAAVDVVSAATLPLAGLTAIRLLRRVGALPGRRLLMTGASGGVGHFLTELATAAGASVTAVSSSAERGGRLRELGATVVTDLADADGPYDVVLESIGGETFHTARRLAGTRGRVIWFGQASRQPVTLDFFDWVDDTVGAVIEPFHYAGTPEEDAVDLAVLVALVAAGRLHPEVGAVRPWTETADVVDDIRGRRVRGNAVLTVGMRTDSTLEGDL